MISERTFFIGLILLFVIVTIILAATRKTTQVQNVVDYSLGGQIWSVRVPEKDGIKEDVLQSNQFVNGVAVLNKDNIGPDYKQLLLQCPTNTDLDAFLKVDQNDDQPSPEFYFHILIGDIYGMDAVEHEFVANEGVTFDVGESAEFTQTWVTGASTEEYTWKVRTNSNGNQQSIRLNDPTLVHVNDENFSAILKLKVDRSTDGTYVCSFPSTVTGA